MSELGFYTVDERYIDYLVPYAPHLFHNAKADQRHSRKYIGVILEVNGCDYFAPLSSFKEKHRRMKDALDFVKVKDYAVINLNCMFPVPKGACRRVDFSKEKDASYRSLLLAEYRTVKQMKNKIRKNATNLYRHKIANGNSTRLAARCNDFVAREEVCRRYVNDCPGAAESNAAQR